jgi:hypothetical protein
MYTLTQTLSPQGRGKQMKDERLVSVAGAYSGDEKNLIKTLCVCSAIAWENKLCKIISILSEKGAGMVAAGSRLYKYAEAGSQRFTIRNSSEDGRD